MEDSRTFYLVPGSWYYKNGDKVFGATVIKKLSDLYGPRIRNKSLITCNYESSSDTAIHNTHNIMADKDVIVYKKRSFKYKDLKIYQYTRSQRTLYTDAYKNKNKNKNIRNIVKLRSMSALPNPTYKPTAKTSIKSIYQSPASPTFKSNFFINTTWDYSYYFCSNNPLSQLTWKVYRCQLNTQEESCCCSCNSDAMFEVMKSLYDCYKKKNCDNCNCILCGHLPREERRLGELRKSGVDLSKIAVEEKEELKKKARKSKASLAKIKEVEVRVPSEKLRKAKAAGVMTPLEGKKPEEKEKILKGLTMHGIPLPEAKTASEKKLIDKVRTEMGLPPEPKTPSIKEKYNRAMAAGLITPLQGKSDAKKEEILRGQVKMGLPLPVGRTPSEKALIAKVKSAAPAEAEVGVQSEKLRKAKAAGLLTPLEGKKPEQKEKILKGLAMHGIPLPEAKTASEKKLINKVRAEVGLPPEPKTPSAKEKYNRAMAAGLITPLQGKSEAKKEEILRGEAKMGLHLPEGRTPSEKALIAKVKATALPEAEVPIPSEKLRKVKAAEVRVPSEKLRKAKGAGLLTPLEGKKPEQKEKILKGLAMHGIPLPEAKTDSEKKLIDKVRAEVGLPPEPKTPSAKEKYNRAMAAGLITPLEGKSKARKEEILRGQANMGLPLTEGRTPSEKALIAEVKATTAPEAEIRIPPEKLGKAKAAGLLTPLEGKIPEEKEKILKGLAMSGIPLPEAKTVSDKKLIDKVRADVGLPPEPKTPSAKENYNKAMAAGLITPLEGKSKARKEEILRGQAKFGLPLPEGRTPSEKALIAEVKTSAVPEAEVRVPSVKAKGVAAPEARIGVGRRALPPEKLKKLDKKTAKVMKEKKGPSDECICDLLTPESEREVIGISAIKAPSLKKAPPEKAILAKEAEVGVPSEKLRKAKAAGLLTPLEGKKPEQKEKILKGLAMQGIPLPEAKTSSEKKLVDKVRAEVGLPPEPKTPSAKEKYNRAMAAGLITPLQGKSEAKKEEILRGQAKMGLPLPEGRTPSEKALIAKVKATAPQEAEVPIPSEKLRKIKAIASPEPEVRVPSEKLRKAKAAGLLTPLEGKKPEQKEKILKGLAMHGIPLPEAKTASEKNLIDKVRVEVGLPPEPKTPSAKEKYNRAMAAGLITPLQGKSEAKKEEILRGQAKMGLPLPEGRTPSEKALIAKVKATAPLGAEVRVPSEKLRKAKATAPPEAEVRVPSEKLRKAKAAGLLTPLEGKKPEQKEKLLKGLAMHGIPLPEAKTASEKKLIDKVRAEVGLPPEPKTSSAKEKYNRAMAAGLITPLQGKSDGRKEEILRNQAKMGLPLPEGRTPSEKALIAKVKATAPPEAEVRVPSEKLRKARAAGLLTPLEGKKPEQKERILKDLAMHGMPLPEPKSASEKKLIDKVRAEVGLPPEPKTPSSKEKYKRAMAGGLITPLQGKSDARKEEILRNQAKMGLPLPEGRTPSEKALIAKVKATAHPEAELRVPSEKLRKAKAAGLLTPLEGKKPEQKEKILKDLAMRGIPLPEAKTASEKKLIDKVRAEVGLPPAPETPSTKEKYKRAMAGGLITPLQGKSDAKKEEILRGQAKMGIALPEGRTPSERALIAKVRGIPAPEAKLLVGRPALPPEKLKKLDKKTAKVMKEKKGPSDECICDLLTPESEREPIGISAIKAPSKKRTLSEKAILAKKAEVRVPSEKLRKAKAAGLLTPLEGKKPEQKENILKGLAIHGIPLPEAKTASEKKLIDKVRAEVGLPPEPKSPSAKEKYNRAMAAGFITPLQGKSDAKKEEILRGQAKMGLPLPEGRTPSEKALIAKVKATAPSEAEIKVPSEKLRKARAAGLLTPLEGKKPEQKERILKDLAMHGMPLPEPKSASEKKLIDKVRAEVGLPPEPKTPSSKEKYKRAMAGGVITPLQGKSDARKEEILRNQAKMGLPLPEGRTPSEKALIAKVKATTHPEAELRVPSEKLRKAKAAGLLTPLEGKKPEQKEKILKDLAMRGIPLPEAKTASEKKLIDKVRAEVGLPPAPKTPSAKEQYTRAMAAGLITPLQGKSDARKEEILRDQAKMGIPLPEGRTSSEKALIAKVKATAPPEAEARVPSEKLRKAKGAGLLTPLEGKKPEQKEKILKGLAMHGIPLPEAKTASEKKLIDKVRAEVGLPPEPKTPSAKEKYNRAMAAGIITPLQGKSDAKKEEILQGQAKIGLPLPEGRTPSEKALIAKVKANIPPEVEVRVPSKKLQKSKATVPPEAELRVPSEKLRRAKAAGLLTPLEGKKPEEKEKILKGLAMHGIPLPEAKTASEKKLIDKVRAEVGLPPEPKTPSAKDKYNRAMAAGLITPLKGKSEAKKEEILRGQAKMGLSLPEGHTPSEKAIVAKVKATVVPEAEVGAPTVKAKGIAAPEVRVGGGRPALPPEKLKRLDTKTAKIMKEKKGPSDECICDLLTPESEREPIGISAIKAPSKKIAPFYKVPSEKLRKAEEEGILTPLEGKTPEEKERILKGLAMKGIPLPEAKSASEKKIIDKVRTEVGLPPEPKTPAAKKKYKKAMASGLITPLQGKSAAKKEEILRGQAKMGLALPEGRTPSERAIIAKVKTTTAPEKEVSPLPSETPIPSEKLRKAKTAGLLTPLEGKTPDRKEQILTGLAEASLPLPEGKTPSEKSLIQKVKTKYGIPPKAKTPSEKEIVKKAKAEGLLTPLKGKSIAQKEKILKGLAEAGLPMPEGTTPSEKALVQKVRTMGGLPRELTPSEKKGTIKKRSKKIGVAPVRKSVRGVGVSKSKGGIVEEFQDIIKTTTCDRGCGCDKKKIRFKHSYVKIRVTSPDISSLCPCPEECLPGVKGGVFTDNEGIKVTIGRVLGVPSFPSREIPEIKKNVGMHDANLFSLSCIKSSIDVPNYKFDYCTSRRPYTSSIDDDCLNYLSAVKSTHNSFHGDFHKDKAIIFIKSFNSQYEKLKFFDNEIKEEIHASVPSTNSSFESIYLLKTDSSISVNTKSDPYSVISFSVTEISSCSDYDAHNDSLYIDYDEIFKSNENHRNIFYSTSELTMGTDSKPSYSFSITSIFSQKETDRQFVVLKAIQSESNELRYLRKYKNTHTGTKIAEHWHSNSEIFGMVCRVLSKQSLNDSSSLIIIMPTSSDDCDVRYSLYSLGSTICIQLSENHSNRTQRINGAHCTNQNNKGFRLVTKGKYLDKNMAEGSNEKDSNGNGNKRAIMLCRVNQECQTAEKKSRIISTDTTQDRPCCCPPKEESDLRGFYIKEQRVENIVSELVTPMILKEAIAQGLSHEAYRNLKEDISVHQSHTSLKQINMHIPTPVRVCKIPPCSGHIGCHHRSTQNTMNCPVDNVPHDCTMIPCSCSPDKIKEIIEKTAKEMISIGCGNSKEDVRGKRPRPNLRATIRLPGESLNSESTSCNSCRPTQLDDDTLSCLCSNKKKNVKGKGLCPCEQHKKPYQEERLLEDAANKTSSDKTKSLIDSACQCKNKARSKKKNIICECPEEPELEFKFEMRDFIDETQIRKMKSELTQTVSGFKLNIPRKRPEPDLSFEEILKFYAESTEKYKGVEYDSKICSCNEKTTKQNASVDCECPNEPPPPVEELPEEPFQGIKFHIGGKGSESKGLSGILCFELFQEPVLSNIN